MSPGIETTIMPPYWGVPRLSHQFPVVAVVDVVLEVNTAVVVVVDATEAREVDVTTTVVLPVLDVGVLVDVDVEQDIKATDATMRKVNAIQITPLFIQTSLYFSEEYLCAIS